MAAASRPPPAALTAEPSPAEWVSRPPRVLGATCRHAGAEGAAEASQQLRLLLATRARLVADSPDMASSPDGIRSPTAAVALQGAALPRLSPLARMGASLRQQRVLDSAKYKARAELQHRRAVETCKQISRSSALGRCLEQVKTGSEEWELNRAETRRALFQRQAAFFESIDSKMIDKLEGEGDCDGGSKVGLDTATDTSGLSAVAADVDARLSLDATTEAPVEVGEEQREDKDKGRGTHSSDSSLLNYFPSDSMRGYASALNSIHTSVTAKHEERMQAAKFAREQQESQTSTIEAFEGMRRVSAYFPIRDFLEQKSDSRGHTSQMHVVADALDVEGRSRPKGTSVLGLPSTGGGRRKDHYTRASVRMMVGGWRDTAVRI